MSCPNLSVSWFYLCSRFSAYTTDQSGQTWREPVLDLMFKPDVILAALALGSTIFLGLLLLHHRM